MGKKPYISMVVLDEQSRTELLTSFKDYVPLGWKLFGHHMTIKFGSGLPFEIAHLCDESVTLVVTHIGISDKAIAVKVNGFPSFNKIPHITIAVNDSEGGKPVMSNNITDWKKVNPIELTGSVVER